MFYCSTTGQYIQEGNAFEINGVQYPANWLNLSSAEDKSALCLEEVIATNSPGDDRYYWVSQHLNGSTLTYVNTPKDLAQVKTSAVTQLRSSAYSLLFPTDWMVVKAMETSTPIDPAWNTWRASIRSTCDTAVTNIEAATDVDAVATAMINVSWPHDPNYVGPVVEESVEPVVEESVEPVVEESALSEGH